MSILLVENLYKTYGEKTLFDKISFSISEKQRIGLIGPNGTGKSSLLKALAGLDPAEKGSITHANQFKIEYVAQEPELDEELSILEQIYYGDSTIMRTMREYEQALLDLEADPANEKKLQRLMNSQQKMDAEEAWEANTVAKTVLTKLGLRDFSRQVKFLSGGQKKRVAIAKALIQPADLLILDEPTNHLDNETVEWLETFLAGYKGSLLMVTHDRYFLNRVTNHIFELDNGKLYVYEGNYETYLEKKAEREELALQNEDKRQNTLRRELAWLRRGAKARTTKQKARIQRVESLQEETGPASKGKVEFAIGSQRLGKKVIEVQALTKSFDDKKLVDGLDYLIVPGERLGIIGPNGSGKTTLLNMLAGRMTPDSGSVEVGETVKIGYYTQDHDEFDGNLRMIDYIKETAQVITTVDGQTITAEQMLERFLFPRYMQYTYIRKLSGGEKRRLYMLKVLMEEPNVLFLDEPTNDLDIQTLSILEEYLENFPGVVLTVSHDRYFLDRVVDHLLAFEGEGKVVRFQGSYSDYMEEKKERDELAASVKASAVVSERAESNANPPRKEKRKKLSYKEQQEWDTIEDRIMALEEKKEQIEAEIVAAGSDFGRISELYAEQKKVETELETTMERWEELSLLVEELEK
ncbi:ABC-F family ATP-binding cassette domain-containing protein [Fictibacillus phosphorivorans]|uniref:ABC-F family ATP-binding cassette domain-containing protein n=1 Tax=Fictibacillus phosphorivorans TaxID=1221500 RepID=UPI00204016FD|nr:ABC-F family ATP-binding cassette domain-containing protein [Fictibacillus phosphorivorans]MCM3719933.1 ABC-F family ATP-binding cassette domain-containing protein [Fictibacillus phosphorivorans]MCM3777613.1 ABC-F family ATP-binding cassette domain-containing protein [Fictibacillus phosphorivorans]